MNLKRSNKKVCIRANVLLKGKNNDEADVREVGLWGGCRGDAV